MGKKKLLSRRSNGNKKKRRFFRFFSFIIALFSIAFSPCTAQEIDIYKQMIKESVRMDFILDPTHSTVVKDKEEHYIELNVNKNPLPRIGYNHQLDSFFYSKNSLPLEKDDSLSPNLLTAYTNTEEFDPNSTETTGDLIANGFLSPVLSIMAINPLAFIDYLMRIGVLSNEPFLPKETKKERALRIIKEMYKADE